VKLRFDDVERQAGLWRPDENRLRADPAQRSVQRPPIDAETAVSPYRFDVNSAIPSLAPLVDEVTTPSEREYPVASPRGH
jgi:hypothetical protein